MENKLSIMDLLLETHINLKRQGPGSLEVVEKALNFIEPLNHLSKIADLGCGTGGQSIILANYLSGTIVGLDMFPKFIDKFNENIKAHNLQNRVSGIVGFMENLPFEKNSLDLIWSEGAIDNIGFENGLSHWYNFLKKDGFVAVTCPSWLTDEYPNEVDKFWREAGSQLNSVSNNIEIMEKCGYKFISAFTLPEECWTENYFIPRELEIKKLSKKYLNNETLIKYAEQNQYEVELFSKYKKYYGYVFYIGKKI